MGYFDIRDGRRKSDPLTTLDGAPAAAPDWQLTRVVSAQDADFATRAHGVNCGNYERVRFAVVPHQTDPRLGNGPGNGGTANPNVEVFVWSESAQLFVSFDTPITKSGVGAGDAYMVDVPNANGSILFLAVTNALAAIVAVSVQGYGLDHTL